MCRVVRLELTPSRLTVLLVQRLNHSDIATLLRETMFRRINQAYPFYFIFVLLLNPPHLVFYHIYYFIQSKQKIGSC